MAKQAKPKPTNLKGRNSDRPNGKAWKKSWGSNPPVGLAQTDHALSIARKGKR